jgi:hypothetical protein
MDKSINPKIEKIREILENRGFAVDEAESGISILLESGGEGCGGTLDIYALEHDSEQIRARLRKKLGDVGVSGEELEDRRLRAPYDLEYFESIVGEGLRGVAAIGRFHYFGCNNDTHYYYAQVELAEEPLEEILRKRLAKRALEQLGGVDSKTFRLELDTLGLKRSSIVRLALTRIFRSASDTTELLNSAAFEAVRIVKAGEWKYVRQLVNENKVPFLSNILYILWYEVSRYYMKRAWETLHG